MDLSKLNHCIDMQRNKEAENEEYLAELYRKFHKGISIATKLYLMQLRRKDEVQFVANLKELLQNNSPLLNRVTISKVLTDDEIKVLADWLDIQIKEYEDAKTSRWGLD